MNNQKKKILFVCTGNICRSPLAHALFQKRAQDSEMDFEVQSVGTQGYHVGDNSDPRMRKTAANHGLQFNHQARKFRPSDIEYYDYIFVMDSGHYRYILSQAGRDLGEKLRMFREFDPDHPVADSRHAFGEQCFDFSAVADVPDPYYGGQDGFELVFNILDRTITVILEAFRKNIL